MAAGGRRRAAPAPRARRPLGTVVLSVVGAGLAAVGWFFLVRAAIGYGASARANNAPTDWALMAGATVLAIGLLLLVLVLLARGLTALGVSAPSDAAPSTPTRVGGGHRRPKH